MYWRHPKSNALVFKKCLHLLRDSSASFLVVISPLVKKGRQEKDSPGKSILLCLTFPRFSMWSNRIHFNACLRTISTQKGWRENGKSMNSILFPMLRRFLCLFFRKHKTIESCSRWVCFRTTSRSMGSSQSLPESAANTAHPQHCFCQSKSRRPGRHHTCFNSAKLLEVFLFQSFQALSGLSSLGGQMWTSEAGGGLDTLEDSFLIITAFMGHLVKARCCCTHFTYTDAFKSLKNPMK